LTLGLDLLGLSLDLLSLSLGLGLTLDRQLGLTLDPLGLGLSLRGRQLSLPLGQGLGLGLSLGFGIRGVYAISPTVGGSAADLSWRTCLVRQGSDRAFGGGCRPGQPQRRRGYQGGDGHAENALTDNGGGAHD
jgi:hypothetical protein